MRRLAKKNLKKSGDATTAQEQAFGVQHQHEKEHESKRERAN